jgi:hypothetical protein
MRIAEGNYSVIINKRSLSKSSTREHNWVCAAHSRTNVLLRQTNPSISATNNLSLCVGRSYPSNASSPCVCICNLGHRSHDISCDYTQTNPPWQSAPAADKAGARCSGRNPRHVIFVFVFLFLAEAMRLADPATSISFPKTMRIPSNIGIPPLTLVGVGVRTVSFLGIKVYSVGFYVDLDNPNLKVSP